VREQNKDAIFIFYLIEFLIRDIRQEITYVKKIINLSFLRQQLLVHIHGNLRKGNRTSTRKLGVIKFFTTTESLTQPCLKIFTEAEHKIEHLNI